MTKVIVYGLLILFVVVLPMFIFVTMQMRALRSHNTGARKYWITDLAMFGWLEGPLTTLLLAEPKLHDERDEVPKASMAEQDGFAGGYIMPTEERDGR